VLQIQLRAKDILKVTNVPPSRVGNQSCSSVKGQDRSLDIYQVMHQSFCFAVLPQSVQQHWLKKYVYFLSITQKSYR